MKMPPDTIFEN